MFSTPPEPLTPRQRAIVLAVAAVCAVTRFLAVARSLWDWDEALFTMAMRDYDVTMHHPHPPGFPVFMAMAKLVRFVVHDDFRALQTVNVVAAMLVFVAVFLFARELRLRFATCVSAGALFAFFPNVWFFGGGAFSDIPSIVLVVFAVTFLLKAARDGAPAASRPVRRPLAGTGEPPVDRPASGRRAWYWFGTLLRALAIGIRPQNLLVGLVPGFLATRRRRWWEILVALLIGAVIVGAAFGGAIHSTGSLPEYQRMVREHADYIARVDSFRSDARPPLWRIFDRFFIKQYQSPVLSIIASLFVVISVAGAIRERNRSLLVNAMTFLPFAVFAWLMLDRFSISRFSIGYQPMFALFVADGIARVAKKREWMLSAAMVAAFVLYTFPALTPVRNEIAPSLLAARAAAERVDPEREQLFVGHTMVVFVDLVAPGLPYTHVEDDRVMPIAARERAWLLAEVTTTAEEGLMFRRERGSLWNIARRHYFEVKLAPLTARPRFIAGWYAPESTERDQWRWMNRESVTLLPPVREEATLRIQASVPAELIPKHPTLTVKLNGRVIGRVPVNGDSIEGDFDVAPAPRNLPNVLELSIDHTVLPRHESRELGLRLRSLGWGPA
ncbi:MAG: hypothetical protein ACXWH7_07020 [Thermoanaerobaculia bacterium]